MKMYFYWWNALTNVGDAASFYLIKKLTTEQIIRKDLSVKFITGIKNIIKCIIRHKKYATFNWREYIYPWQKCIVAIGSVLDLSNKRTIIWGSGFREFNSKLNGGKILAVRGKLSLEKIKKLGYADIPIGDPALLLPIVFPVIKNISKKIKIVPHFVDYDYFKENYHGKYELVNVQTTDVESFIKEIIDSRFILSTSFHGIIIAHAYGIPALWIQKNYICSSQFKFYDYFSSVGIEQYEGFKNIDEILSSPQKIESLFKNHKDKSMINEDLYTLQKELLKVAPFKLKKEYLNF